MLLAIINVELVCNCVIYKRKSGIFLDSIEKCRTIVTKLQGLVRDGYAVTLFISCGVFEERRKIEKR